MYGLSDSGGLNEDPKKTPVRSSVAAWLALVVDL